MIITLNKIKNLKINVNFCNDLQNVSYKTPKMWNLHGVSRMESKLVANYERSKGQKFYI